jgi:hypothetical protein
MGVDPFSALIDCMPGRDLIVGSMTCNHDGGGGAGGGGGGYAQRLLSVSIWSEQFCRI